MSHIVTIQTRIYDATAVRAACKRLNLAEPVQGKAELFSGTAEGLLVNLPNWVYPAVVDLNSGEMKYDNFEERWGEQKELDRFLQCYACEKVRLEARRYGRTVTETQLAHGYVKLGIAIGGAT